jgi:Ala-tRNA(Pro) deacylase
MVGQSQAYAVDRAPRAAIVNRMAATEGELLARLDALGIRHQTHRHPPVFTVAEAQAHRGALPGGHCKCLFLADRGGGLWLIVMLEHRRVDLKKLSERLAAPRLSFAATALLAEALVVAPGSVTPFAVINDPARRVAVVLDAAMLDLDLLNYHPLHNAATTAVAPHDLVRFLQHCGHAPRILHLADIERDAAS